MTRANPTSPASDPIVADQLPGFEEDPWIEVWFNSNAQYVRRSNLYVEIPSGTEELHGWLSRFRRTLTREHVHEWHPEPTEKRPGFCRCGEGMTLAPPIRMEKGK